MAKKPPPAAPLLEAVEAASAPCYLVSADRTIVQANAALCRWVELTATEVLGRRVAYHSEPEPTGAASAAPAPLASLCPPPAALAGERMTGAISTQDRAGRLVRRRADFMPLASEAAPACPVLVVADAVDLDPGEATRSNADSDDPSELHAALLRLRTEDSARALHPGLIGTSPAAALVRSRIEAAIASQASVLVRGEPQTQPAELARLVFQRSAAVAARLVVVDADLLPAEAAINRIGKALASEDQPSLLIERIDALDASGQNLVADLVVGDGPRLLATALPTAELDATLGAKAAAIEINLLPLADRHDDLPLLVQAAVESVNAVSEKQLAGCSPEALDMLTLHAWPGGFSELQDAVAQAHERAEGRTIAAADLPIALRQAALAAELPSRRHEAIILDEFLGTIERELVERALERSQGNKAEAARLLGMTRPRLYRRLARLGMLDTNPAEAEDL